MGLVLVEVSLGAGRGRTAPPEGKDSVKSGFKRSDSKAVECQAMKYFNELVSKNNRNHL